MRNPAMNMDTLRNGRRNVLVLYQPSTRFTENFLGKLKAICDQEPKLRAVTVDDLMQGQSDVALYQEVLQENLDCFDACAGLSFVDERPASEAGNLGLELGYWMGARGDHDLLLMHYGRKNTFEEFGRLPSSQRVRSAAEAYARTIEHVEREQAAFKSKFTILLLDNFGRDLKAEAKAFVKGFVQYAKGKKVFDQQGFQKQIVVKRPEDFKVQVAGSSFMSRFKHVCNSVDMAVALYLPDDRRADRRRLLSLEVGFWLARRELRDLLLVRSQGQATPSNIGGASWLELAGWSRTENNYARILKALRAKIATWKSPSQPPGLRLERIAELQAELPGTRSWRHDDFRQLGYSMGRYPTDILLPSLGIIARGCAQSLAQERLVTLLEWLGSLHTLTSGLDSTVVGPQISWSSAASLRRLLGYCATELGSPPPWLHSTVTGSPLSHQEKLARISELLSQSAAGGYEAEKLVEFFHLCHNIESIYADSPGDASSDVGRTSRWCVHAVREVVKFRNCLLVVLDRLQAIGRRESRSFASAAAVFQAPLRPCDVLKSFQLMETRLADRTGA